MTSNLIGIIFARSLHYQFYSWYSQQLPLLTQRTRFPFIMQWVSSYRKVYLCVLICTKNCTHRRNRICLECLSIYAIFIWPSPRSKSCDATWGMVRIPRRKDVFKAFKQQPQSSLPKKSLPKGIVVGTFIRIRRPYLRYMYFCHLWAESKPFQLHELDKHQRLAL